MSLRLLLVCATAVCCVARTSGSSPSGGNTNEFPYLPPLLQFENGTAVTTVDQWETRRRPEIKALLGKYLLGTAPQKTPQLLNATEINSTTTGVPAGGTSKFFFLEFEHDISFFIEVLIPPAALTPAAAFARQRVLDAGEPEAFPVFLTQWNHREWALLGVNRGYVGVVYPGADTRDAAPQFQRAYSPEYTMALIRARALVASSALDFVLSPPGGQAKVFGPRPINASQVCVTGHR